MFLKDVQWIAQASDGLSGGLLTVWNIGIFNFKFSFNDVGFLGICVEWKGLILYIVNVYSPCNYAGKRRLWDILYNFKLNNEKGEWCIGGDFNAVLHASERKGCSASNRQVELTQFNYFMEMMEVVDLSVLGKRFTWFCADGKLMSRLDRFLVSEGFVEKGEVTGQWVGDRDILDHCPIWLLCSSVNWGPKPFRVNNCWLEHPDFNNFVKRSWNSFHVKGKKAFVVKEKLKLLKECLKSWNKEVFGILDLNIDKTVQELNEVEGLLAGEDVVMDLVRKDVLNKEFWQQLHYKESMLKQKSRIRWVKEGDSNTRFFHATIKGRRRRNQLTALKEGGSWIQGAGLTFKNLSVDDNDILMAPFSIVEVRDSILSSDGNKCPGPDGFNFNFLKNSWSVVQKDMMEFLHEFHRNATLPKAITASFLALIPKKDHPQFADDTIIVGEGDWSNLWTIKTV
ncbi:cysteine-rich receptor-like protein kinase, partial [Trifolium pratense]